MWSIGQQWVVRLSGVVTFVILGRLLAPADFGAIALAATLVVVLGNLADFGFAAYLVQADEVDQRTCSTAFFFSGAVGLALAVGLAAVAGPLSTALGAPAAGPVIATVAATAFVDSLKGVPTSLLKRRLDFRSLAVRRLVAVVAGQAVAIGMAFAGYGVWALVGQVWTVSVVSLVATWIAARWSPSWQFSRRTARHIAGYGVHVVSADVVHNGVTWVNDALVSRFLGVQALGYVVMATRVVQLTVDVAGAAGHQVAVTLFAAVRHDATRLRNAYVRGAQAVTAVLAPALLGLAATAHLVVPFVLGEQWTPAVPVFALLAAAGAVRSMNVADQALLLGVAQPALLLRIRLATAAVLVAVTAATAQVSVTAVAAGNLAVALVTTPLQLAVVARAIGLPATTPLRIAPVLCSAGVAAAAAGAAGWALAPLVPPLVAALVALVVLAVVHALILVVLLRPVWRVLIGLARSLGRRRQRTDQALDQVAAEPGSRQDAPTS
jgi:O-antigen/teichoic acid export membrane protein